MPTLRKAFKARMAALSSKQLMYSALSTLQRPPVDMPLQVAPQPSKDASVLMVNIFWGAGLA